MYPALRYTISLGVGLVATTLAVELATTNHLITLSLVSLCGATKLMILAHRQQWLLLSHGSSNRSAKKQGSTIRSIRSFTGLQLLRVSVPAVVAGFGPMSNIEKPALHTQGTRTGSHFVHICR